MRRYSWLIILVCMVAASFIYAEVGRVRKHTLWVVPWDHEGVLQIQSGDVIELWSWPLPMTHENLEARFKASRTGRGVELVGEALPRREGTMERIFYFKAFEPGPVTVTVDLLDADGRIKESKSYAVEVAPNQTTGQEEHPTG